MWPIYAFFDIFFQRVCIRQPVRIRHFIRLRLILFVLFFEILCCSTQTDGMTPPSWHVRDHQPHQSVTFVNQQGQTNTDFWTNDKFPDPMANWRICNGQTMDSLVCDPFKFLTPETVKTVNLKLKNLSLRKTDCPLPSDGSYLAYGVVTEVVDKTHAQAFWSLQLALDNFADRLGKAWGVLESLCGNGIMIVYSVKDDMITIRTDTALRPHFPPQLLANILEDSFSLSGSHGQTPSEVLVKTVNRLTAAVEKIRLMSTDVTVVRRSKSSIFAGLFFYIFFATKILTVCSIFMFDFIVYRWRLHRYLKCYTLIDDFRRATQINNNRFETSISNSNGHKTSNNGCKNNILHICSICFKNVEKQTSITCICGYGFHISCANRWLSSHYGTSLSPRSPGQNSCPICVIRQGGGSKFEKQGGGGVNF
eukprot:GHVL01006500.1.p1 GENE.GHVL01006500.1~~GHVL01006500.1.p1  ORF type:complete len:422 (+),score=67.28 GHVL01006500.1:35-1300(+)